MPSKRSGSVASSFNSSIYVLGGQSVNGTFVTMHSTTRKVKYGHLRYRCQHLVLDWRGVADCDTIYAIGGKLENGKATGVNEIFHPATVKHQRSK